MWFQGLIDVLLAKCFSSILSLPGPDVPACRKSAVLIRRG